MKRERIVIELPMTQKLPPDPGEPGRVGRQIDPLDRTYLEPLLASGLEKHHGPMGTIARR